MNSSTLLSDNETEATAATKAALAAAPISANFFAPDGVLTAIGNTANDTIVVSRNAAGTILVNSGNVPIASGPSTVDNTSEIQAFGHDGNDVITLNEAHGALPAAMLLGGDGNDTLTGGSGADQILGEAGDDRLNGAGGNDQLLGGEGDDVLNGGAGDDQLFGEGGNDSFAWRPGEGLDVVEGGAGIDTLTVNGGADADTFFIQRNGTHVFVGDGSAVSSVNAADVESIVVTAGAGDDTIIAGNGLGLLTTLTLDGGAGNDSIVGGDGADLLIGGTGSDTITGGRGADVAQLGSGDDSFVWNPGDGSDVVEGDGGTDTLIFNGSNIGERIDISANGTRAQLTRDVGFVTMDLNRVERINVTALGGADTITVHDMSGSGVKQIGVELSANGIGDGADDVVDVHGSDSRDKLFVQGSGDAVTVTGVSAAVTVNHAEATDTLLVSGDGGDDVIDGSALAAGLVHLTEDGGAGNDTLIGSKGDDTFVWNPDDGSDIVDGQAGADTLRFNASNAAENIAISAVGDHVDLSRNVGSVTMHLKSVEQIDLATLGGADTITVHDMSGTDLKQLNLDLGANGSGDGANDVVVIEGTSANDVIRLSMKDGALVVDGLATQIVISHFEAGDQIHVLGLGGDDVIDASRMPADGPLLVLDGGDGADVLVGGAGDDELHGGSGDDVLIGGAGQDVLDGGTGDNVLIHDPSLHAALLA